VPGTTPVPTEYLPAARHGGGIVEGSLALDGLPVPDCQSLQDSVNTLSTTHCSYILKTGVNEDVPVKKDLLCSIVVAGFLYRVESQ
jgi:hypothetical protein